MEGITYNLSCGQNPDRYYTELDILATEVIEQLKSLEEIIGKLRRFLQEKVQPSDLEYALEFLTIGVLWREHGRRELNLINFSRWLRWLAEREEYRETVGRLQGWEAFLRTQKEEQAVDLLREAAAFATFFSGRAREVLGRYTENVGTFLQTSLSDHLGKEDYFFCSRREAEYHLQLVGAEIMNRAFRSAFLSAPRKTVLLPVCLRPTGVACQMKRAAAGQYVCGLCTENCHICQLNFLGREHGFQVLIVPHESVVFAGDNAATVFHNTGVVGVACALTLLENGWKAKRLGIPVQCVPLDYCGCKAHWHPQGISTRLNIAELARVLGIAAKE